MATAKSESGRAALTSPLTTTLGLQSGVTAAESGLIDAPTSRYGTTSPHLMSDPTLSFRRNPGAPSCRSGWSGNRSAPREHPSPAKEFGTPPVAQDLSLVTTTPEKAPGIARGQWARDLSLRDGGGGTRTPKGLRPPHFECGALPVRATPPGEDESARHSLFLRVAGLSGQSGRPDSNRGPLRPERSALPS